MGIQLMHVFDAASLMQSCSIKLPMPSYHSGIISEAKCLVWLSTFILKIHSSLCRSCARLSALLICSVQFNMALVDIIERSATLSDRMLSATPELRELSWVGAVSSSGCITAKLGSHQAQCIPAVYLSIFVHHSLGIVVLEQSHKL